MKVNQKSAGLLESAGNHNPHFNSGEFAIVKSQVDFKNSGATRWVHSTDTHPPDLQTCRLNLIFFGTSFFGILQELNESESRLVV